MPSSPVFQIVAGEPRSVVVIVPTQAVVGDPVEVFVKGEDQWGNPTEAPDVSLDVRRGWRSSMGGQLTVTADGRGAGRGVVGRADVRQQPDHRVCRTSPRSGSSGVTCTRSRTRRSGTGTEVEYFRFGRDWAHLDVMSHQGNDFQMTNDDWRRLEDAVREHHEDGRFVVFPGFEWSANTPAGRRPQRHLPRGGHADHALEPLAGVRDTPEDEFTPAHPADDLFAKLREHVRPVNKVVVAAHCGGRYADIRKYFDEEIGPLVEVVSCWGVFEWLLWDAFDKGYRVGVMCNSDGHKGRPGAEGPGAGQFGIWGGLTCMLAPSLTRADVFTALKERRCYGTTGPRIDLDFAVNGSPMGSVIDPGPATVEAAVRGVGPLESLELLRGRDVIEIARPPAFAEGERTRGAIRIGWGGARIRGRGRRSVWDGTIEVEGAAIERAATFAFDSPNDRILEQSCVTPGVSIADDGRHRWDRSLARPGTLGASQVLLGNRDGRGGPRRARYGWNQRGLWRRRSARMDHALSRSTAGPNARAVVHRGRGRTVDGSRYPGRRAHGLVVLPSILLGEPSGGDNRGPWV